MYIYKRVYAYLDVLFCNLVALTSYCFQLHFANSQLRCYSGLQMSVCLYVLMCCLECSILLLSTLIVQPCHVCAVCAVTNCSMASWHVPFKFAYLRWIYACRFSWKCFILSFFLLFYMYICHHYRNGRGGVVLLEVVRIWADFLEVVFFRLFVDFCCFIQVYSSCYLFYLLIPSGILLASTKISLQLIIKSGLGNMLSTFSSCFLTV